jgi:uncharacterized glyoxalase superfamily protein PhnB
VASSQKRPTDLFVIKRYDDAARALDWLEQAFGFERQLVVPGPDDTIAFAMLRLGDDIIGTGTVRPGLRDAIAVYLENPDEHYERARAAGAEITQEVEDTDFGARIYGCKDLDGHNWSFGTGPHDKPPGCDIFPVVGYRDPVKAIDFLKRAFGIEERLIVPGPDGTIAHAELGIGYGVIMPTTSQGDAANPWAQIDFGLCVYVDDPDAQYARATAAGAGVVRELKTEDYGARGFTVRDIEGTLWNFGNYRPAGTRP